MGDYEGSGWDYDSDEFHTANVTGGIYEEPSSRRVRSQICNASAWRIPAGVTVFAVAEKDANRPTIWGRNLIKERTTRDNTFTSDDLVQELATALVFRLPKNAKGYALLYVQIDNLEVA